MLLRLTTATFSKTALRKLHKFCPGTSPITIFVKKLINRGQNLTTRSDTSSHEALYSIMKTKYFFFVFHTQIDINYKKGIVVVTLNIFQFKPMYVPKNIENAPGQVLTLLRHFLILTFPRYIGLISYSRGTKLAV